MRQILLAGAPTGCWTNLGDEAILAGMVSSLRAAWPDVSVAVVSSNPQGFLDRHGCAAVPFRDVDALAETVAAADAVLLGGGSIFFDYWGCDPDAILTPHHHGLTLWAGLGILAAAHDTPLIVYGAGLGPLGSEDGRRVARSIFERARVVCLRDERSAATLRALGLDDRAAVVTADAALSIDLPPAPALDCPRPWLGVALRQWDVGVESEHWQAEVASALDWFVERHGGTVLLVPCHRAVRWPLSDDTGAGHAVRQLMVRRDRVHSVDVERPWTERAALLGACDQVLAMRYHAALFALSAGVPTVALSYDPKVESLMGDWGFEDLTLQLGHVDRDRLTARLVHAHQERRRIAAEARRRTAELRMREREHIRHVQRGLSDAGHQRAGEAGRHLVPRLANAPPGRPASEVQALGRLAGADAPKTATAHRRRVAILTNRLLDRETGAPCIGGAERYALDLAILLRDLGLEPTFFQREGVWRNGEFFGFPVIALPRGGTFSEFEPGVGEAFFQRTDAFDHVLYLMPNYASGPMRQDAVVVCHGVWWDHDLYRGKFAIRTAEWYEHLKRAFMRPRRVVSVDTNSINVVRALFPDAAARMSLIPSGVDTNRFHPAWERREDTPLVLFPRRADVVRGAQLVGPILCRLPDPCRFLWVGDGGLTKDLQRVATRDPRLTLRTASFDEMPDLYRRADICVIPSVGSEGQSLACLEAMASGCAVVATRVGGLPELIRDGVDGLLCEPSAEALAAAIHRLLRDPPLRRRLGAAARVAAERRSIAIWRARWSDTLARLGWVERPGTGVPYDIVCLSIINWEARWQRPQQMAARWAQRGRRVFYTRVTDFLPTDGKSIVVKPLAGSVWEVTMALPDRCTIPSAKGTDVLAPSGLRALRALREAFDIDRAIAVVQIASWTPLAVAAREAFGWPILYDCMDDWSTFPTSAGRTPLLALEAELVGTADLMTVSSRTLQKRWSYRRPDALLARNAADFDFFEAQGDSGSDPLAGIDGPVAGYVGAIAEWFDRDLMVDVAKARPDVTFVLVGGIHRVSPGELETLPNVRLEGSQPYVKMPLYLRRFDVCLVPFQVSPVTDCMDVVKFYEYASLGKPVVATPIREILSYSGLVYVAGDKEAFVRQLDLALNENDPDLSARRIAFARQNTWDDRLDRIEAEILGRVLEGAFPLRRDAGVGEHDQIVSLRRDAEEWRGRARKLQGELDRWRASRSWRLANVYWRGRGLLRRMTAPWRSQRPSRRSGDRVR